jgi:hypothetical protein
MDGRPGPLPAAGIGDEVMFATKPEQAWAMIERAVAGQVPFVWVAGDEVYVGNPGLRSWLQEQGQCGGCTAFIPG